MTTFKYLFVVLILPALGFHSAALPPVYKTDTTKTGIAYTLTFIKESIVVRLDDTFYVAGDFILEPNKTYDFETFPYYEAPRDSNGAVQAQQIKQEDIPKKLANYLITNWRQQSGMIFDLNTPSKIIKAYSTKTGNDKIFGYPLVNEFAVMGKSEEDRQAYISTGKDTLINNKKYIVVTCSKKLNDASLFDNKPGVLQKAVILLDPRTKESCFPFISKLLCERFGGALVHAHYYYDQNREIMFDFRYRKGLTASEDALMNQHIRLYTEHQSSLDTVRNNIKNRTY